MAYRVLVCGDRKWKDKESIRACLSVAESILGEIEIIEGEAQGADIMSREIGEESGWTVHKFPADWDTYGRAAGPIRNTKMRVEGKPDCILAFQDNIIQSRGTKNMVTQAQKAKIPVWISTEGISNLENMLYNLKGLF